MHNLDGNRTFAGAASRERTILRDVYVWMSVGLFVTAVVSLWVARTPALMRFAVGNPFVFIGLIVGQIFIVFTLPKKIIRGQVNFQSAVLYFLTYAVLNGVVLSAIFFVYPIGRIYTAFFVTAATFGVTSLWALTTKRDLSGWGHYLLMGLMGLMIALLVNFFLRSPAMDYFISFAGVLLFTGLTAYDTQKILKMSQYENAGGGGSLTGATPISVLGALILYIDFIALFVYILRFLSARRD